MIPLSEMVERQFFPAKLLLITSGKADKAGRQSEPINPILFKGTKYPAVSKSCVISSRV